MSNFLVNQCGRCMRTLAEGEVCPTCHPPEKLFAQADDAAKSVLSETWAVAPGSRSAYAIVFDGHNAVTMRPESHATPGYVAASQEKIADRVRFAACAPEALRLLLEAEYVEIDTGDGMSPCKCPWCDYVHNHGHDSGCRWLALMAKAGLR